MTALAFALLSKPDIQSVGAIFGFGPEADERQCKQIY